MLTTFGLLCPLNERLISCFSPLWRRTPLKTSSNTAVREESWRYLLIQSQERSYIRVHQDSFPQLVRTACSHVSANRGGYDRMNVGESTTMFVIVSIQGFPEYHPLISRNFLRTNIQRKGTGQRFCMEVLVRNDVCSSKQKRLAHGDGEVKTRSLGPLQIVDLKHVKDHFIFRFLI